MKAEFAANQAGLNRLLEQFDQFSREHRIPLAIRRETHLVLDEMVSNVITHGSPARRRCRVSASVTFEPGALTISLVDDGRPFNPLTAPKPDMHGPAAERASGGLGVHLVRNLMDRVEYERRQKKNRLLLTRLVRKRDRPAPRKAAKKISPDRG